MKIPEIKGHWLTGSAASLRQAPHRFVAHIGLENGGLARFRVLNKSLIACSGVSAARHVLVKNHENYPRSYHRLNGALLVGTGLIFNEGDEWLTRRRLLLPAFRAENMNRVFDVSVAETRRILDEWVGVPSVVAQTQAQRLTLNIIAQTLLSARLTEEESDRFSENLQEGLRLVRGRNVSPLPLPMWIPTRSNRRMAAVRAKLDAFADAHLDARTATPEGEWPDDILTHMMRAKDPEPLSRDALRDETKTLFTAGYETTATSLTWCLYLLAKNPEVAAKWHAELDRVLGGKEPDFETLNQLDYTAAIIHESLRLYPSVYATGRRAVEDDVIDGYEVKKGDVILLSIFGVHRDPSEWKEPELFLPERFMPDQTWNKDAFMPFLVGKHRCIGNTFAHIELMVAVAMIGQRYEISLPVDFHAEANAFVTLTPDRDIPLTLRARN